MGVLKHSSYLCAMRTLLHLMLCITFASGLLRHNGTKPHPPHHHRESPHIQLAFNYTVSTHSTADKRLLSFFKLAHDRVTPSCDIRAVATSLSPSYTQLCASVAECGSGVKELLADHQNVLQSEWDRIDRLRMVLHRVMKDGVKHRGLWRRRPHHHEDD